MKSNFIKITEKIFYFYFVFFSFLLVFLHLFIKVNSSWFFGYSIGALVAFFIYKIHDLSSYFIFKKGKKSAWFFSFLIFTSLIFFIGLIIYSIFKINDLHTSAITIEKDIWMYVDGTINLITFIIGFNTLFISFLSALVFSKISKNRKGV